ncbi:hypothetical protein [Fulvivirga sp.]
MVRKITKAQKAYMKNPIIQFFKFIYLNIRIMKIVAGGHGGTRK